jgi:hypothetical protein
MQKSTEAQHDAELRDEWQRGYEEKKKQGQKKKRKVEKIKTLGGGSYGLNEDQSWPLISKSQRRSQSAFSSKRSPHRRRSRDEFDEEAEFRRFAGASSGGQSDFMRLIFWLFLAFVVVALLLGGAATYAGFGLVGGNVWKGLRGSGKPSGS